MRYDDSIFIEHLEELLHKVRRQGLRKKEVSDELCDLFQGFIYCPYIALPGVRHYDEVRGKDFSLATESTIEVSFKTLEETRREFLFENSHVDQSTVELHIGVEHVYARGEIEPHEFKFCMYWKGLHPRPSEEVAKEEEAYEKARKRKSVVDSLWGYYREDILRRDQEKEKDPEYQKYIELRKKFENKGGRG